MKGVFIACYATWRYKNVFVNVFLLRQRDTDKDKWAVRAFETWRSNREKLGLHDKPVRCFKTSLENISTEELNDSRDGSFCIRSQKRQDGQEYPVNALRGL